MKISNKIWTTYWKGKYRFNAEWHWDSGNKYTSPQEDILIFVALRKLTNRKQTNGCLDNHTCPYNKELELSVLFLWIVTCD